MKKIGFILIVVLTVLFAHQARSGVFVLAGSGVNIAANTTTNFTNSPYTQVASFNFPAQNIYLSHNGITNTNQVINTAWISLDGTNYYKFTQTNLYPSTNPANGTLYALTNITLPVYLALSVSNGQAQIITNFTATLQF